MRLFILCCVTSVALSSIALASNRLTLKNGMVFEGNFSDISKLSENPLARNVTSNSKPIVIVDDELRRTYFPKVQLAFPPVESGADDTPIRIDQPVANVNASVGGSVVILGATPFDDWGRRTVTVRSSKGTKDIVQGITEVSHVYCRVQGLRGEGAVNWDMRMATSSIPLNTLRGILLHNDRKKGAEAHLDIVRLLFQAERYVEADRELTRAMEAYPELEDLKSLKQQLIQQSAQRLLREIEHRKGAGQHRYVWFLLHGFPSQVDATENLIQAKEMLEEYEKLIQQRKQVIELLEPLVEKILDASQRKLIDQLYAEIKSDLNVNNMDRMTDFLRFADAKSIPDDAKLSIAISGWLLGQGSGKQNLAVTSSLLDVRNLVREYMRAMGKDQRHLRKELADRIRDREGGTPENVAKLLEHMKPPHDLPPVTATPGNFVVEVPGTTDGFPVKYHVQLPPEYDPYRRYPLVVTLHAAGTKAEAQLEWWTGPHQSRTDNKPIPHFMGPASRDGYIVLAPEWTTPRQGKYEYSAREHHVVLASLRDAMRRFSVDSDHVVLSGHALGGDAAWDIGSAHPDLWAGMVLIGARSDYGKSSPQYVTLYSKLNPKPVPMYFVFGELDGNKMADNSISLNRYLKNSGFDPVVVQYQGRGNEHFYEEIQRIHQWMRPLKREFFPQEFEVRSMRPWDNYFWYVDLDGFPPASMVSPLNWPPARNSPCLTTGSLLNNRVSIRSGASLATVWLSPEMVNFEEPIEVKVNGKKYREDIAAELDTVLEDARSRADRQHIFWTKVKVGSPRK